VLATLATWTSLRSDRAAPRCRVGSLAEVNARTVNG
jgi:hypothetical protein